MPVYDRAKDREFLIDFNSLPPLFKDQIREYKLESSLTGIWITYAPTDEVAQKQTAEIVQICTKEVVSPKSLIVLGTASRTRLRKKTDKQISWSMNQTANNARKAKAAIVATQEKELA